MPTGLDADMRGTEILEPLKHIYNTEVIPGYLRQIFVFTDGEGGNTDEVLGLTKAKAHESRVLVTVRRIISLKELQKLVEEIVHL